MPQEANNTNTTNLIAVPVAGTAQPIMATQKDGTEWSSVTHVCQSLGIDPKSQRRKLKGKSWACEVMMTLQVGDQRRNLSMVDRRTLTMWLATIDASRVSEEARPVLEAYQSEAADALDAYFHKGGAINPNATEDQLADVLGQAKAQLELIQLAKGIIHDDHLDAQARIVLARGLGNAPELDPTTSPLYAHTFLDEKGVTGKALARISPTFGKRLKASYTLAKGREPAKYPQTLPNGQVRNVNAYTEADRPLMDQVWDQYYAEAK